MSKDNAPAAGPTGAVPAAEAAPEDLPTEASTAEIGAAPEPAPEPKPEGKAEKAGGKAGDEGAGKDKGKGKGKGKKARKPHEEPKEEEAGKVVEEKTITVNLRHAFLSHGNKAAPKSVNEVKKMASRVFDTEAKIDNRLNNRLWSRGKGKSERRISVRVQKLEDGTVRVLPAEA